MFVSYLRIERFVSRLLFMEAVGRRATQEVFREGSHVLRGTIFHPSQFDPSGTERI